jgi:hypothetical protein
MFHQEHIITSEFVRVEAPGLAFREVLVLYRKVAFFT